jgi:hypothetical protein
MFRGSQEITGKSIYKEFLIALIVICNGKIHILLSFVLTFQSSLLTLLILLHFGICLLTAYYDHTLTKSVLKPLDFLDSN